MKRLFTLILAALLCSASAFAQERGGQINEDDPYFQVDFLFDSRKLFSPTAGGSVKQAYEAFGVPLKFNLYGYTDLFGTTEDSWGTVNSSFTEANLNLETFYGITVHAETDVLTSPGFSFVVGRFGIGRVWDLLGGSLRVNLSPLTKGSEMGKYQANAFWYFPAPEWMPLSDRLSFSGFFDANLDPRRIITAPHVAFEMIDNLYFVTEYRHDEFFKGKDRNAVAVGFSYRR